MDKMPCKWTRDLNQDKSPLSNMVVNSISMKNMGTCGQGLLWYSNFRFCHLSCLSIFQYWLIQERPAFCNYSSANDYWNIFGRFCVVSQPADLIWLAKGLNNMRSVIWADWVVKYKGCKGRWTFRRFDVFNIENQWMTREEREPVHPIDGMKLSCLWREIAMKSCGK